MSVASVLGAFRTLRLVDPCTKLVQVQIQPRRWRLKENDRRYLISTTPKVDLGTQGEMIGQIDTARRGDEMYPDADTPKQIFNGIAFSELPICHIKTSKNNTIISVTDYKNQPMVYHSCGLEGFKNARKGTNVAAQAAAISTAKKAITKGIHSVRVKIDGLGPGRMSSVKGLQMAGLKIISVTDSTHVSWCPPRPRKARRL
ncbi:unnamed protein product [Allacma fusca]|uniref:Ribosomal protein S11 n=1 Tax=Allacma fusca TaxID=39272 RepID=A0A8J2LH08_9HEXA|nr:unnamed protein product [Allacma fusca]